MQISIIIPTYQRHESLFRCIDSFIFQLEKHDEIIIVTNFNDLVVLKRIVGERYANRLCRLKVVEEKRRGVSYARNTGFKLVKNELCVFLDDDCVVDKDWAHCIRKVVEKDKSEGFGKLYLPVIKNQSEQNDWRRDLNEFERSMSIAQFQRKYEGKDQVVIDWLWATHFFGLTKDLQKIKPLFDAQRFPFWGEEQDLALRAQLLHFTIVLVPSIRVIHFKKKIAMNDLLARAFFMGRVTKYFKQKYVMSSKGEAQSLFNLSDSIVESPTQRVWGGYYKSAYRNLSIKAKSNKLRLWLAFSFYLLDTMAFKIGYSLYRGRL